MSQEQNPKLRWASWAAVSSQPQASADKVSIPEQLGQNRAHADKHGGTIVAELVIPGESRSIDTWEEACTRIEAYAQLRALLAKRAIDVLVFYDATRLGRTASLVTTVRQLCTTAKVALYETTNPPNEIQFAWRYDDALISAIKSVGSQQEVAKLVERNRIGMKARSERGQFPNNINYAYRKRYTSEGTIYVDLEPDEAEVVRLICQRYTAGHGSPTIAIELNHLGLMSAQGQPWTKSSVINIVQHAWIYAGYVEYNQHSRGDDPVRHSKGRHPAIITEDTATAVDSERAARRSNRRLPNTTLRYAGVCYCAECGRGLSHRIDLHTLRSDKILLQCQYHKPHTRIFETEVTEALGRYFGDVNTDNITVTPQRDRHAGLRRALANIEKQINATEQSLTRADDAYIRGQMTDARYQAQIASINQRAAALDAQLATTTAELAAQEALGTQATQVKDVREYGIAMLHHRDPLATNTWLRRHVKVYCTQHNVAAIVII